MCDSAGFQDYRVDGLIPGMINFLSFISEDKGLAQNSKSQCFHMLMHYLALVLEIRIKPVNS